MKPVSQFHWCGYRPAAGIVEVPVQFRSRTSRASVRLSRNRLLSAKWAGDLADLGAAAIRQELRQRDQRIAGRTFGKTHCKSDCPADFARHGVASVRDA